MKSVVNQFKSLVETLMPNIEIGSKLNLGLGLLAVTILLGGCAKNPELSNQLWGEIFTNMSPIIDDKGYNGGNKSGNLDGRTRMTYKLMDDGKIRFHTYNVTGSIYTGYTPWSDAYILEYDDLWNVDNSNRRGFGGRISASEQGTTEVNYNIRLSYTDPENVRMQVIFFNEDANWSQWGYWTLENDSIQANFINIVESIDFK
jgi:hypothetical protein